MLFILTLITSKRSWKIGIFKTFLSFERQIHREFPSIYWFTPYMSPMTRTRSDQSHESGTQPRSHTCATGTQLAEPSLQPPRYANVSRSCQKQSLAANPGTPKWILITSWSLPRKFAFMYSFFIFPELSEEPSNILFSQMSPKGYQLDLVLAGKKKAQRYSTLFSPYVTETQSICHAHSTCWFELSTPCAGTQHPSPESLWLSFPLTPPRRRYSRDNV